MKQVDGELQYQCVGCLWLYPSLTVLQNHINLRWMEGFSCCVFYWKLREVCLRNNTRKLHERVLVSSGAKKQLSTPHSGQTWALLEGVGVEMEWDQKSALAFRTNQILFSLGAPKLSLFLSLEAHWPIIQTIIIFCKKQ